MGSQFSTGSSAGSAELKGSVPQESNDKWSLVRGVPDEITVNHILTKLQWRELYALAALNRAWQVALKSREVYDARVRAKCTQTLVAMIHDDPKHKFRNYANNALSLYDSSASTWHLLPRMPSGHGGIPEECGCVSSLGKLYILGGRGRQSLKFRNEVYAFNLFGLTGWKQCASMKTGRAAFACEVKDGKIYVFGGIGAEGTTEVYDPEQDMWQSIAPMLSIRMHHKVVDVDGEFYVQLSKILGRAHSIDTQFAEVYDPRTDHWRKVQIANFNTSCTAVIAEAIVVIDGTVHRILDNELSALDKSSGSWKFSQSISWDVFERLPRNIRTLPFPDAASAIAVNGELLALVYRRTAEAYIELTPLKSQGLGIKDQELIWKIIPCSLGFLHSHSMCTVDL